MISTIAPADGDSVIRKELPECKYGFQGWTVEEVLEDVMGMTNTSTPRYQDALDGFEKAISEENYDDALHFFEELNALLHPTNHLRKLLRFQLAAVKDR